MICVYRHQRANRTPPDKPNISPFPPDHLAGPFTPVCPAASTEPAMWGHAQIFVNNLKEDRNLEASAGTKERLDVLPKAPRLEGTQLGPGVTGTWKQVPGARRHSRGV